MAKSTLRVEAGPMVAGGDALVRRKDEKVMFVEGALPGEVVDVEIVSERSQMVNARVIEIIEPSPDRVEPTCALFHENCGGCQWNYISSELQNELKTDIVRDALTRIAKLDQFNVSFNGAVSPTGYRTTMRMATRDGRPGMRRLRSHDVLNPIPCTITHRLLHPLITDGRYGEGEINLRASVSTGDTTSDNRPIVEHVNGQDFRISGGSFFQSGPEAAALLSSTVDALVPTDAQWIIDAYAGIGVLGAILASKRSARITAIETNESAAEDARYNLRDFEAEVVQAEVSEVELFDEGSPDVVVADPSRSGLGKSATRALVALEARTLILVSCDPASMARDTNLLHEHGYELDTVRVLDLFPQTPHVETVSVFNLS